jgi:hypothetical protein
LSKENQNNIDKNHSVKYQTTDMINCKSLFLI